MLRASFAFALLALSACGLQPSETSLRSSDPGFFENSMRRSSADSDNAAKAILNIADKGCSGFFVSNSGNKNLMGTARHCFEYKPEEWCSSNGRVWDTHIQKWRNCKRVAVDHNLSEFLILELDGPAPLHTLVLNDFKYPVGTRLQILGYPADEYRSRGINVTENCWILKDVAPLSNVPTIPRSFQETHFLHNCSTYEGNSGGPMVLEGTSIVVAIPSSYYKNDFLNRNSRPEDSKALVGLELKRFVERKEADLEREGVQILKTRYMGSSLPSDLITLLPGGYTCSDMPDHEMVMKPAYNTSDHMHTLTFWKRERATNKYGQYVLAECSVESGVTTCKSSQDNVSRPVDSFVVTNSKAFVMIEASGKRRQCQLSRLFSL